MLSWLEITAPWQIAVVAMTCALIIFYGRIDIATGVYCSIMFWAYNVDMGPTTRSLTDCG